MSEPTTPNWLRRAWSWRLAPNVNKRGQFAPIMQRQSLSILLAIGVAVAFEYVLFGLLGGGWSAPWVQVRVLNGDDGSRVQPAIALLTPIIALVSAVFSYRKSTLALAESQRADVAAFQQRFIDGARLLADPSASTRIAGAAAMGSLARDWLENRQECVDVLCGYLRVEPLKSQLGPLRGFPASPLLWGLGEDTVRLEVIAQLGKTLTAASTAEPEGVPIAINLSGACLPGLASFAGVHFRADADFTRARFTGTAVFSRARFEREAVFTDCSFLGGATDFDFVNFRGRATFKRAEFAEFAIFLGAIFAEGASFLGANFGGPAIFQQATITSQLREDQPGSVDLTLGPLGAGSHTPDPPGSIVDSAGKELGSAVWLTLTDEREQLGEP